MKNVLISWVLPTTRQLGGPLLIADIANTKIELSADGGATYSLVGDFSGVLEVPVNDLPFSDQYMVRGTVIDTTAQSSNPVVVPFAITDTSPPGDLAISLSFS